MAQRVINLLFAFDFIGFFILSGELSLDYVERVMSSHIGDREIIVRVRWAGVLVHE